MDPARVAIRASTQDHLEIEDVKDSIVVLKDGGACLVLAVTSINFNLLSEKEQEATIYAYAALLNSLTFPVQVVIRSQQKDISSYLNLLNETAEKKTNELIRQQIYKYANFIKETVQKNNVLDKKFYLVVPMSTVEISAVRSLTATFKPTKRKLPFDKTYILEKAKINLYPKRDHILRLLGRLGIKGRQLNTQELIKLFFEIYNPESHGQQIVESKQYQSPLIQSTLPEPLPEKQIPQSKPMSPLPEKSLPPAEESSSETMQEKINDLVKKALG